MEIIVLCVWAGSSCCYYIGVGRSYCIFFTWKITWLNIISKIRKNLNPNTALIFEFGLSFDDIILANKWSEKASIHELDSDQPKEKRNFNYCYAEKFRCELCMRETKESDFFNSSKAKAQFCFEMVINNIKFTTTGIFIKVLHLNRMKYLNQKLDRGFRNHKQIKIERNDAINNDRLLFKGSKHENHDENSDKFLKTRTCFGYTWTKSSSQKNKSILINAEKLIDLDYDTLVFQLNGHHKL